MTVKEKVEIEVTCYDLNGKKLDSDNIFLPYEVAQRVIRILNYRR